MLFDLFTLKELLEEEESMWIKSIWLILLGII